MKLSAFEITRYLFLFTVIVLIALGAGSLMRIGSNPDRTTLYIIYAIVMFGDALLLGFCAWQLPRGTKFIFFFSVFVLVANIFPTIFDQFGFADLLFVLLNLTTLIALIVARKDFLTA